MSLNKKSILAAAAFVAVFFIIMFFVAAPLISNIKNIGVETSRLRQKIAAYDGQISKTREFETFVRQENNDLKKLGEIFVDGQMPLDFINSLEAAARDAGVQIKLSSLPSQSREVEAGGWPSISIEAEISGQIPGILRFVKEIENSFYLVEVRSFNIEAGAGQAQSGGESTAADGSEAGSAHILMQAYAKS